ncbi:solute carrier family 12 member 8 isoform X2 [Lycorma delicatula]|uniref:solute carrier family 12 member 8 isoform X2 n=1 Tax=Lycorma delicatula TaxID=130591 RepID=UPI003F51898A
MDQRPDTLLNGKQKPAVDWSRYGLYNEQQQDPTWRNLSGVGGDYGTGGHQPADVSELFAGEQNTQPWWKSQFFISQPILFGVWDGVFTSCLINVFGVIVFLRSGWIVAEAGVLNAVLMVLATVGIALISVLSAVGICERCRMESGGVYFLLAHVLGSRLGAAVGLLYVFGQAVGCALFVLGFGESVAELFNLGSNRWVQRAFGSAAILLLGIINVAGVKWVVKLQFILLLILLLAGLDFAVGSFIHTERKFGFDGWFTGKLVENALPSYSDGNNWFTVFGVFFPTITGIMAGINMSGDLHHPATDIPNGTLIAVATATGMYLMFVLFLGSTCTRQALRTDFMIAAKVSAIRVMLLAGLYVSSMSSCLGAMYGTPRVLQSIANENVIPIIQGLGKGRGPNRVPVYSMAVVALVTLSFLLVGDINSLAPIVTMPFLMMYAALDYSYFALAQTFDILHHRELRFRTSQSSRSYGSSPSLQHSDMSNDLDSLFPERSQHRTYTSIASDGTPTADDILHASTTAASRMVHSKRGYWYSSLCNRWLSLFGAILKLGMMFLVHWSYALANCGVVFLIWVYVGLANPAVKPGVATHFKFFRWLHVTLLRLCGKRGTDFEEIVVAPATPGVMLSPSQLTDENEDFSNRQRFHQTATIRPMVDSDPTYSDVQILR